MRHFTSVYDVDDLHALLALAQQMKTAPRARSECGRHRTLGLFFLNPSLRTRLSTQRAAHNLGLEVTVMDAGRGWQLELEDGVVMDGSAAEHIREAAGVLGRYFDLLGVRTFAGLSDRTADYEERVLHRFMEAAGTPILSLESATRHPLQSLADLLTIEQHKNTERPRVVLSWAPHPRALPQAVANSFAEWVLAAGYELTIACPEGFELDPAFTRGARIAHDQREALRHAHFVYAKNWAAWHDYGRTAPHLTDWMITPEKMALTEEGKFMHCLPVRRNVVVHEAVLDSPASLVLEQAENRIWTTQAVLFQMLQNLES